MSDSVESLSQIQQQAAQKIAQEELLEQVEVTDAMTELAEDPLENTAAAFRAQQRHELSKNLENRKWTKETQTTSDTPIVEGLGEKKDEDLARQFQEKNPELPADRLMALKKKLSPHLSLDQLQQLVESFFSDPTLTDAAFDYLVHISPSPLKEQLIEAKRMFFQTHQREVIGGKNITAAAREFVSQGLASSPSVLRTLYADVTAVERPHNDLFDFLSQKYSFSQLQPAIAFLLQCASYELKSEGPSIEKEKLLRLMQEVKDLESILGTYLFFEGRMDLMQRLYKELGAPYPQQMQFETLAKTFMRLVNDRYPTADKMNKAIEQLNIHSDPEKVIFLSQFQSAVRNLSPRLYQSIKHRDDLLLAFISALEQLESDEEPGFNPVQPSGTPSKSPMNQDPKKRTQG